MIWTQFLSFTESRMTWTGLIIRSLSLSLSLSLSRVATRVFGRGRHDVQDRASSLLRNAAWNRPRPCFSIPPAFHSTHLSVPPAPFQSARAFPLHPRFPFCPHFAIPPAARVFPFCAPSILPALFHSAFPFCLSVLPTFVAHWLAGSLTDTRRMMACAWAVEVDAQWAATSQAGGQLLGGRAMSILLSFSTQVRA